MNPNQPQAPPPGDQYNFIVNPEQPSKGKLIGKLGGNPFIVKIGLIVGGAVVLMIVLAIVVSLLFGGKTNVDTIVSLAQSQQEIVRLSDMTKDSSSQTIRNAAGNTRVSVQSHQNEWLNFLSAHKYTLDKKTLALKTDATNDARLQAAEQTSTFDSTYTDMMRSQLESYARAVQNAYQGSPSEAEREILTSHYDDTLLLLKQWPE